MVLFIILGMAEWVVGNSELIAIENLCNCWIEHL